MYEEDRPLNNDTRGKKVLYSDSCRITVQVRLFSSVCVDSGEQAIVVRSGDEMFKCMPQQAASSQIQMTAVRCPFSRIIKAANE